MSVTFSDRWVEYDAGCNRMTSDYRVDATSVLHTGARTTTLAGCTAALAQREQAMSRLMAAATLTLAGDQLTIVGRDLSLVLTDREVADPDLPLVGTDWRWAPVADQAPSGYSQPPARTGEPGSWPPRVRFTPEGRFTYADGCNVGGGRYAVTGSTLSISQRTTTDTPCGGHPLEHLFQQFDPAFVGPSRATTSFTITYAIEADRLTLSRNGHSIELSAA